MRSYDHDQGRSPDASGVSTPHSPSLSDSKAPSAPACERGFATPLKLFKAPTLRQYFHRGILWRASGSEEVQSFELFIDLLYVGIVAINGDVASEDPTGLSLLRFVITFNQREVNLLDFLRPLQNCRASVGASLAEFSEVKRT